MEKPALLNWHFVRMATGLPVEENVVESILTTIDEKGIIQAHEMGIGIQGFTQSYSDGVSNIIEYDCFVDGTKSKLIGLRKGKNSGELKVLTATYDEYVVSRDEMVSEAEVLERLALRNSNKIASITKHGKPKSDEAHMYAIAWTK